MKLRLQLLLLFRFLIGTLIYGQNGGSFVPNYSFEDVDNGYPSPSTTGFIPPNFNYNKIIEYWSHCNVWTHTLKPSFCWFTFPPVNTPDLLGTQLGLPANKYNPRTGDFWGHTSNEILIAPTKYYQEGGLNSQKYYFLEFFYKGKINDHNKYVVGYSKQPKYCGYTKNNKPYHKTNKLKKGAELIYNGFTDYNPDGNGWIRHRGYFSLFQNKKWISVGEVGEFDDLRIYEVQPNKCRTNWYFDNTVFNYPMEVFQVSGKVYLRNGVDPENGSNHILGNVIQYANSKVVLRGGNRFKI